MGREALDQDRPLPERLGAFCRGHHDRAGAVAIEAAIEQTERIDDKARGEIVFDRHRLFHHRIGVAQCVLAERCRDGGKILARRAVLEHVAAGAKGVLRHGAEMPKLRPVLTRPLCRGYQIVLRNSNPLLVSSRPAVAPIAAHHSRREAGLNRHDRKDDRQNLTRATIVEAGAEVDIDAESRRRQLMKGVDVVGAAHDQTIDVLLGEAGFVERALDSLFQKSERIRSGLSEAALAGPDNGVLIPQTTHSSFSPIGCDRSGSSAVPGGAALHREAPAFHGHS